MFIQALTDYDFTQKSRIIDKSVQSLIKACLAPRYSTKSEKALSRKEVQIEVDCSELLDAHGQKQFQCFLGGENASTYV